MNDVQEILRFEANYWQMDRTANVQPFPSISTSILMTKWYSLSVAECRLIASYWTVGIHTRNQFELGFIMPRLIVTLPGKRWTSRRANGLGSSKDK